MRQVQIKDIERLVIKPGEVLVVTVQNDISAEEAAHLKEMVKANLPDGLKILMKTKNIGLAVIADESHD